MQLQREGGISWCDATWNPIRGCSRVSEGCRHCYAERMAARDLPAHRSPTTGKPFALMTPDGPRWTGRVELIESKLDEPLHWRKPQRIFVNSMSDLFHESLSDEAIDRVFGVMALCPQHTFMVLTKRAKRMCEWSNHCVGRLADAIIAFRESGGDFGCVKPIPSLPPGSHWYPLPWVQLGVSVEDQPSADERIPLLLQTPAAVRFVSYEPALGPVDFTRVEHSNPESSGGPYFLDVLRGKGCSVGGNWGCPTIDWLICGGESGPGARPMSPAWARAARDQAVAAAVPFFFKQWGEYGYFDQVSEDVARELDAAGELPSSSPLRLGKRAAGRVLDGREWNESPEVTR